jgi:hypothetical protein
MLRTLQETEEINAEGTIVTPEEGLTTTTPTVLLTGEIKAEKEATEAEIGIKIKEEDPRRTMLDRDRQRLTRRLSLKKGRFATTFLLKGSARTRAAPKSMVSGIALHNLVDSRRRGSAAIG